MEPLGELRPGDELTELALDSLEHGINSVTDGGPLIPFAFVEASGGRALRRFMADTLEDSIAAGRSALAQGVEGALRATLAYDGFVTLEEQRTDAIYVEAFEVGTQRSFVFVQRYEPATPTNPFNAVGNAALLGVVDPLIP